MHRARAPFMSAGGEDRGVSAVIGAVLLLLVLVLLFSTLQTTGVPDWNHRVEFDHNQRVQEDLEGVRNAVLGTAADGNRRSAIVELGTTYPRRLVLQNPSDPTGTLRTGQPATIVIVNATAPGGTGDYWDGSPVPFSTRPIVYSPSYNFYTNAPDTVREVGVLYNRFDEANLTLTEQTLIEGNRITLITVNGSLEKRGRESVTVDVVPVSAPTRAITLENESAPITIELPTRLPNATWTNTLEDEYVSNGGHIVTQSYEQGSPYNTLVLKLERDVSYTLKMAQVGVGTTINDVGPYYIVNVTGNGEKITVNEKHELVVEVRDRFNNPVSNALVNASVVDGNGTVTPENARTNEEGRATFTFVSESESTSIIETNISSNPLDHQKENFTVTVSEPGGNPVRLAGIRFNGSTMNGNQIDLTFENTIDEDRNITTFRMVFYQGGDPDSGTIEGQPFEVGGVSIDLDPVLALPADSTSVFTIDFDSYNPSSGDWFVFTVTYDTGQTAQYFGSL